MKIDLTKITLMIIFGILLEGCASPIKKEVVSSNLPQSLPQLCFRIEYRDTDTGNWKSYPNNYLEEEFNKLNIFNKVRRLGVSNKVDENILQKCIYVKISLSSHEAELQNSRIPWMILSGITIETIPYWNDEKMTADVEVSNSEWKNPIKVQMIYEDTLYYWWPAALVSIFTPHYYSPNVLYEMHFSQLTRDIAHLIDEKTSH